MAAKEKGMIGTLQAITRSASAAISIGLEELFFRLGRLVARYPYRVIAISLICIGVGGLGLFCFNEQKNMVKLWIPENSDFSNNHQWLTEHFPPTLRFQSLILVDDTNVLRPEVIQYMYQMHKKVRDIRTNLGHRWEDKCFRLPVLQVDTTGTKRRRRDASKESADFDSNFFSNFFGDAGEDDVKWNDFEPEKDTFFKDVKEENAGVGEDMDPSVMFYPEPYCGVVKNMKSACFESSLLEMFGVPGGYDLSSDEQIQTLTQPQLINLVNTATVSGVFLKEQNYSMFLGDIQRNSTGHIIGAKSTYIHWFSESNVTSEHDAGDPNRKNLGLDDNVDSGTLEFELALRKVLENVNDIPAGLKSFANVHRSFGDISTGAIWDDVSLLIIGYSFVYIFVQAMIGRFNRVEQRGLLGVMALANAELALLASFGFCSLLNLEYGPMHSLIPCLLVGLGVDNAFVIVQEFNNAEDADKKAGRVRTSLEERIGNGLRQAGVAITVTSLTDVIVFAVGGTTSLPSLKSYSLFAAVGILFTFLMQVTFFVACLTIDTKRIDERRDGMLCWLKHNDWKPNAFSQRNILQEVFKVIGNFLERSPVKWVVILATSVACGLGIYGNLQVEIEFDFLKFLPSDTSLAQWYQVHKEYFPSEGFRGTFYFSESDLLSDFPKLRNLSKALSEDPEGYLSMFDPWYPAFEKYLLDNYLHSTQDVDNMNQNDLNEKLTQFLYSPHGGKYRHLFKFENESSIECGKPAAKVIMHSMLFQHKQFYDVSHQIEAMRWVKQMIKEQNFKGIAFAMSQTYSRWEIDEVIGWELKRNLIVALGCVTVATMLLIADFKSCLLVFVCVLLNLINVVGFMHFWGLTIDIVACTNIIISVGLCVDYSAHIAHSFMHQTGTKNERMVKTLTSIGPAVFNGGVSTLIAIIMLVTSKSHVFISYFKIFLLMITFGLFHGLIFLPVLLSLIGSDPYIVKDQLVSSDKREPIELKEVEAEKLMQSSKEGHTDIVAA